MARVLPFPTAFVPSPAASSVEPVEEPEPRDFDDEEIVLGPLWANLPGSEDTPERLRAAQDRVWDRYMRSSIEHGHAVAREPQRTASPWREIAGEAVARGEKVAVGTGAVLDVKSEAAPAAKESNMGAQKIADAARDEQIVEAVRAGASAPKDIHEATGFSASCLYTRLPALVSARKLVKTGNHRAARYSIPNGKGPSVPPPAPVEAKKAKPARSPRPAAVTPTSSGYRVIVRGVVVECSDIHALKDLVEELGS